METDGRPVVKLITANKQTTARPPRRERARVVVTGELLKRNDSRLTPAWGLFACFYPKPP